MKKFINLCLDNFYFSIFYLFTCFTFVSCMQYLPYINYLPKIALIWGILISFYHIYKMIKRRPTMVEWFILSFLTITLILNLLVYYSSENLKIWLVNFVIMLSFAYVNQDKSKEKLNFELNVISIFYLIITFFTSAISLYYHFSKTKTVIGDIVLNDTNGVFTNKNTLGIACAISIIIALYIIFSTKNNILHFFSIINLLIQSATLYFSEARGPLLMLIGLILVLVMILIKNKILQLILFICPFIANLMLLFFDYETMYKYTTGRNGVWLSTFEVIKKNYLFGVGNDGLVEKIKTAIPKLTLPPFDLGGTHNIYIQILSVNGPFALIIFLGIILLSVFSLLKAYKDYENKKQLYAILSIIIGLVLVNLFESNLVYMVSFVPIIFWIFIGYSLSLIQKNKL